MTLPALLLFDLGGVLLENTAFDALIRLTASVSNVSDFKER